MSASLTDEEPIQMVKEVKVIDVGVNSFGLAWKKAPTVTGYKISWIPFLGGCHLPLISYSCPVYVICPSLSITVLFTYLLCLIPASNVLCLVINTPPSRWHSEDPTSSPCQLLFHHFGPAGRFCLQDPGVSCGWFQRGQPHPAHSSHL